MLNVKVCVHSMQNGPGGFAPRLTSALEAASFVIENNRLLIKLSADFEYVFKNMKDQVDDLKKITHDIIKRNIDVEITIDTDKTRIGEEKAKIENLKNDEKITNFMDTIKGKIVSID